MDFIPLYLVVELATGDWVMGVYPDARHPMGCSLQFTWTAVHRDMGPMARGIIAQDLALHVCQELGGNQNMVEVVRLGPQQATNDTYYLAKLDRVARVGTTELMPCEVDDLRKLAIADRRGFIDRAVAFDRALSLLKKLRS